MFGQRVHCHKKLFFFSNGVISSIAQFSFFKNMIHCIFQIVNPSEYKNITNTCFILQTGAAFLCSFCISAITVFSMMMSRVMDPIRLPGEGVSTEVCNLQGPAKLNALGDLRNVCSRKKEWGGRQEHSGHTDVHWWCGLVSGRVKYIIVLCKNNQMVKSRQAGESMRKMKQEATWSKCSFTYSFPDNHTLNCFIL